MATYPMGTEIRYFEHGAFRIGWVIMSPATGWYSIDVDGEGTQRSFPASLVKLPHHISEEEAYNDETYENLEG